MDTKYIVQLIDKARGIFDIATSFNNEIIRDKVTSTQQLLLPLLNHSKQCVAGLHQQRMKPPQEDPSDNIFCGNNICTNRTTSLKNCPCCRRDLCTFNCFGDDNICQECASEDDSEEEEEGNNTLNGFTEEEIELIVEMRREHFNCNNSWLELASMLGGRWTRIQLSNLWRRGITDVPRFTNDDRRIPLKDCVDNNGYFLAEYAGEGGNNSQSVIVDDTPPSSTSNVNEIDVRSHTLMLPLRILYSDEGKGGNFVSPKTLSLSGIGKSSQSMRDQVIMRRRDTIVRSMFLALMKHCRPLFELFVPMQYIEMALSGGLMDIPITTIQQCLKDFTRHILSEVDLTGIHEALDSPLLTQSNVPQQYYSERAIQVMREIMNANFANQKARINAEIAEAEHAVSSVCVIETCVCFVVVLTSVLRDYMTGGSI